MFKFEFMVEDKNVATVMRALAGKVHDMKVPVPVANAVLTKDGVKAETSGNLLDAFMHHLAKNKVRKFRGRDVVFDFLDAIGRPRGSAQYIITTATTLGLLRKRKVGARLCEYEVVTAKKKGGRK